MAFRVAAVLLCIAVVPSSVAAQKAEVKHGPTPQTSAASGKQMFEAYCASCHGAGGKGDGPAAGALKSLPADLTALSRKKGGKFPTDRVYSILRGQGTVEAHGSRDMPVWGPVFWNLSQGRESEVQLRIANLARYIESLQAK